MKFKTFRIKQTRFMITFWNFESWIFCREIWVKWWFLNHLIHLRIVWFITLEKLTDFIDSLISFACFSCNFFTRSSSSTIVMRFDMMMKWVISLFYTVGVLSKLILPCNLYRIMRWYFPERFELNDYFHYWNHYICIIIKSE